jgi:hypothetical protein
MKKTTLAVIWIAMVVVIFLFRLWHNHHVTSDAELQREIPGSWNHAGKKFMSISPDGSYSYVTSLDSQGHGISGTWQGTWQIRDAFLILTTTNSTAHIGVPFTDVVLRWKVIHLDDHKLIFELQGRKETLER